MPDLHATLHPLYDHVHGKRKLDRHVLLFGLNMLLVLVGYVATILFNALAIIKVLRIAIMVLSFGYLLYQWVPARYAVRPIRHYVLLAYILGILAFLPFSVDVFTSLERFLTVAPFWLYINAFAFYMRGRYGGPDSLRRFMWLFLVVYSFPVLVFCLSGNPFARLSIYGDDSTGFYSNQLGWASVVVVGCLLSLLPQWAAVRKYWFLWAGAMLLCLWLLLITGSRSSYLSLGAVLLVLLVFSRSVGILPKVTVALLIGLGIYLSINIKESAVAQRLDKTRNQLEKVEPRLQSARLAFRALDLENHRYVTGLGFDVYTESVRKITGIKPINAHNSYLELLVCTGVLVFGIFALGLVVPALVRYFVFDARTFCFVPPILIIPYFENNIGAGQFIFFPWMLLLFFYLHDSR